MKSKRLLLSAILLAALALPGCTVNRADSGMDLTEPSGNYTMKTEQSSYPVSSEIIEVAITNNTSEEAKRERQCGTVSFMLNLCRCEAAEWR